MSQTTAAEVQARFLEEQANIRRFIVTADEFTKIDDNCVGHVTYFLKVNGVRKFFERPPERSGQPFDEAETGALLAIIGQVEPQIIELVQQRDDEIKKH